MLFPLISLLITGLISEASGLCPVPNHHCDCGELLTLNQVTCREVSEIPENLPNSTQVLDVGQGFIGPILDQRQVI